MTRERLARGPGPRATEVAGVAALLSFALTAAAWLSGAFSLFTRGLWYDEGLTQTLVADPDILHSLRALAGGVEMHPPTFYLVLRAFAALPGRADEVVLRSFAWLCMLAGLTGVYATLRFAYLPLPSLAATLGLCAHPLVLSYAVEARQYGLLFAELAWFCYLLRRSREPAAPPRVVVGLVLMAVLTATTHYFGIIALVLVLAGDALVSSRSAFANRARIAALAAGGIAALACAPMMRSQRAGFSVPGWLELPDRDAIVRVLAALFLPGYILVGLVCGATLIAVLWHHRRPGRRPPEERGGLKSLAGMICLALFPFVLLGLSYLYQPVFLERYALPAVIALAPPVAWICARIPRGVSVALCTGFCVAAGLRLGHMAEDYRHRDSQRAVLFSFLREKCPGDAPIVFHMPERLSFVWRYAPDLAGRCYQLDYEQDDLAGGQAPHYFNRDLARRQAAFYGKPGLFSCTALKPPVVYLVLDEVDLLPRFRPLAGAERQTLGFGVFELRFPQSEEAARGP